MPRVEAFNREQVLHKAMQLFWDKGYNATSMQDLVDATSLNRSSIYNSFGGKMDLYKAALQSYVGATQSHFTEAVSKASDPLNAIQRIFESFLPEISTDSRGCMSMNCKAEMAGDGDINKWLQHTQEQTLSLFQKLVQEGQELGVINNKQSCRDYAWHVFNSFQGYRMTGILEKDQTTLRQIISNSLDILK
jgi:TetR/AcrR family transcriptional repressor of nem operon